MITSPRRKKADGLAAMDTFYDRAYSLISSPKAREAFNIGAETRGDSRRVRPQRRRSADADGSPVGRRWRSVRLAPVRRLGPPRRHLRIGMKTQMPAFDQAYATLIRDLDRTGLLDRTLVMVSSEFGRTPKVNKDGGRDHWPKVFSVVLAGGGIKKGFVLRSLQLHGHRARARPPRPRRPRHHALPPARDRRRQGTHGPRRPTDRDRRRRQGPDRIAGVSEVRVG